MRAINIRNANEDFAMMIPAEVPIIGHLSFASKDNHIQWGGGGGEKREREQGRRREGEKRKGEREEKEKGEEGGG